MCEALATALRTIGSTFVWNAANWQTIDVTDFYVFSLFVMFVELYKWDLIYIFV